MTKSDKSYPVVHDKKKSYTHFKEYLLYDLVLEDIFEQHDNPIWTYGENQAIYKKTNLTGLSLLIIPYFSWSALMTICTSARYTRFSPLS